MTGLIGVAEAHARLMQLFAPLPSEDVPLADAAGRVLAADIVASRAQPPFAASAMDGYALRRDDAGAGARLRVIGVSTAGAGFAGSIGPGEAVRIYTGAPVPPGADCILIQEDAERDGDALVSRGTEHGQDHIRPAGNDFEAGARVSAPRRLRPQDVALIAAMGAGTVRVARAPVVALIPTGDELVVPGETPGPDQIHASNNYGLKALLEADGAKVRLLPIARDSKASLASCLRLTVGADLVVTLGGASVGDFDLVRETAGERGLELAFYKVAMRPGKPLIAGRLDGVPLIGLPGNPVSAMVCGHVFLRPAIAAMLGLEAAPPLRLPACLGRSIGSNGPREHYMRAEVIADAAGWRCVPFERQDSALLGVLARANALMVRPPADPAREAGETVEFIWL